MESFLFTPSEDNFLYFFLSSGGFTPSVLAVIILGWAIFWGSRWDKNCSDVFASKPLNISVLALLSLLGLGVGFFYQGFFAFFAMGVFSVMLLLAFIDAKKLAVPDWLNFGLFFLVIFGAITFDPNIARFFQKMLEGLALAGLFAVLRIFGDMISKREILGEADIIFIASAGFLFGLDGALTGIFLGCVFGSAWALFLRLFGKKISKIPLITFIILGLFFGFFLEVYDV
ncbi:prepilin peptidase [Helicobacter sp. 11S02596-1]|uniref:prepilin peptidase n=1 Tax=Helicobacter sp. 11S02596-1 TaxID=1476194 RepID=UPI000BC6C192|nr:prepilin peptidase [Helicobacter sp. 11S02596-1]PAF41415.1 hypothetical protein BJI48_08615 [Helicobacter sp. 11S02596-1]